MGPTPRPRSILQPSKRRRGGGGATAIPRLLMPLLVLLSSSWLRQNAASAAGTARSGAFAPPAAATAVGGWAAARQCRDGGVKASTPLRMMLASASTPAPRKPPANLLAQIQRHSQVIVDTADYEQLPALPFVAEATTNPSIVWAAAQQEKYSHLLEEACNMYLPQLGRDGVADMVEAVPVKFARELLRRLPPRDGRVYFQLDPRHAFDVDTAVDKARFLVKLAADYHGVPRERLVLKIPGSWEGIQATKQLEAEGIPCLVTAVTSIVQAAAAAEAGASFIAPYVGRVTDWGGEEKGDKDEGGGDANANVEVKVERGVQLARDAQVLYKARGWTKTKVMAASVRGPEQARALAGCDMLTISPALLIRLECQDAIDDDDDRGNGGNDGVPSFLPAGPSIDLDTHLSPKAQRLLGVVGGGGEWDEGAFRAALAQDTCGTQVFAQGMKLFLTDLRSLEKVFFDYIAYVEGGRPR